MEDNGNVNTLMLTNVQSVESTELVTEGSQILNALNLNLQIEVHNLRDQLGRAKQEIQRFKQKNFIYDSLSKDLASLRRQFEKTSVALLEKCAENEELKRKLQQATKSKSPKGIATPIRTKKVIPVCENLKSTLSLYRNPEDMDLSSDDEALSIRSRRGRPSMGSCGNIATQMAQEEAIPARLKAYALPSAPLRNRVLIKLHSIKSASTESLESTGRKSIRKQEERKNISSNKPTVPTKKPRTNNASSSSSSGIPQITKSGNGPKTTPAPAYRPALGQSNGLRMVKIANMASVKRSNSNCSTKSSAFSASSSEKRQAFRF